MSRPLDNASVANNLNYLRFELQRVRPELKLIAPRLGEHRFLGMALLGRSRIHHEARDVQFSMPRTK